jgi:hypothetical protein
MTPPSHSFTRAVGMLTLVIGAFVLLLLLANLRSRAYFHGPNYSGPLLAIFIYCAVCGIGLLRRQRWAVLAMFAPGVVLTAFVTYIAARFGPFRSFVLICNFGFAVALLAIPALMLRHSRDLR